MSTDVKLGSIVGPDAPRDAIHLAVAPVQAGEDLDPGRRVTLSDDGKAFSVMRLPSVGIVDPFLNETVRKGQWFWLCLYPGTVTSLRHQWEHPAFGPESQPDLSERGESERWLRNYAASFNAYDSPDEAFAGLLRGLRTGELFAHGSDLHGLYDLDDADELKMHAERYLGVRIDWGRFTFSCSC